MNAKSTKIQALITFLISLLPALMLFGFTLFNLSVYSEADIAIIRLEKGRALIFLAYTIVLLCTTFYYLIRSGFNLRIAGGSMLNNETQISIIPKIILGLASTIISHYVSSMLI